MMSEPSKFPNSFGTAARYLTTKNRMRRLNLNLNTKIGEPLCKRICAAPSGKQIHVLSKCIIL